MPRDRDFKRLVRRRMHKTGESYASARARLLGLRSGRPLASASGGRGMYPFERFTERAKEVLVIAQEEAEDSGAGYIGTEHLLVALLRIDRGLAAQVLGSLGVDLRQVRLAVDERVAKLEPVSQGRVLPADRMKTVIELAFQEVERMGHPFVATEHLLLAILIEGQGVGAQVMFEFGLTLDRVRAEVENELGKAQPGSASGSRRPRSSRLRGGVPPSPELAALLVAANNEANREFALELRPDHLLLAMAEPGRTTASLLLSLGMDLDALRPVLKRPDAVGEIEGKIRALRSQKEEAVSRRDDKLAARLRDQEESQQAELTRAYATWYGSWGLLQS